MLAVCSLTVVVPLYFAVAMAFKTPEEAVAGSGFDFPWPLNLASFRDGWVLTGFGQGLLISAVISVATVAGCLLLASWASYAIVSNWNHKLFRYSYVYLLAAMFIFFGSANADEFKGFYTPWQIPAATAGVVAVMILLTGFLSLRTVLKTDPAEVFR